MWFKKEGPRSEKLIQVVVGVSHGFLQGSAAAKTSWWARSHEVRFTLMTLGAASRSQRDDNGEFEPIFQLGDPERGSSLIPEIDIGTSPVRKDKSYAAHGYSSHGCDNGKETD